jgi:hypothetical protein
VEQAIALSKSKQKAPQSEEELRTISKTAWLSKLLENIVGDYLLPIVEPHMDPFQCGGMKKTSITHYLLRLLDFTHSTLDRKDPHAVMLATEDLSKAYNRGNHNLVIDDLHAMGVPGWLLAIICSYLTGRSLVLTHQGAASSERSLPGGFGAGTWLGGFLFVIKINGALLRPPVPRPLTGNHAMHVKYVDDTTQLASINLKSSLMPDPVDRPRPLNYHERHQTVIRPEENILQQEVDRFQEWTARNKMVINQGKCFSMLFSRSNKHDFPPEIAMGGASFIEEKKTLRMLGVMVQSDLRWGTQCAEMVKRASKTTWVLRRMRELGVDTATLVQYWKAEGRVHLEFQAPVWHSGLTAAQSRSLDRAQRLAMVAIAGWHPSHSEQLRELGLEPLPARRLRLAKRFARRTATRSRHTNLFQPVERPRRQTKLYREPRSRTAGHYSSPLPFLTRLLNER